MTGEELFQIWAPEASVWSQWAKPVLFVKSSSGTLDTSPYDWRNIEPDWIPPAYRDTVLVVELPGELSVAWGMAAASRGYLPVPLYNAVSGFPSVVDVTSVRNALRFWGPQLAELSIEPGAPPAFLLDAARMGRGHKVTPGDFDNRSLVTQQDFPSAEFLLHQGIRKVVLIQEHALQPQNDLAHVLMRWQQRGLRIQCGAADTMTIEDTHITRPRGFRNMFYRLLVLTRFRRSSAGGFGALVPTAESGGG